LIHFYKREMFLESLTFLLFHLLFPPFIFIITLTLVLASFGRSLGIRRLYVKVLLHIFEYARYIALDRQRKRSKLFKLGDSDEQGQSDDESDGRSNGPNQNYDEKTADLGLVGQDSSDAEFELDHKPAMDRMVSRHNVISRKDNLILIPDKLQPIDTIKEDELEDGRGHDSLPEKIMLGQSVSTNTFQRDFELSDVLEYVKTGVAAIIEDEVTQRFVAEELKSWNLLTRTTQKFEYINWKLSVFWFTGFIFRYCVLFPGRLAILFVGSLYMAVGMACTGQLKNGDFKRWLNYQVFTSSFQVLGGALSAVIRYHNTENRPKAGICVANHTTPIDVLVLACDNAYALIGQSHGGFLGFLQRQLSKASCQIWFERSESKDRMEVFKRLKEHVEDPNKLPILIFPEGTCINNTSVMQFKKGSFEVGGVIYPVAIKYDAKFGDAFWNSSENGMVSYLFKMMTSWAIVVDVWYLPPMYMEEGEDAITFANRVKRSIAQKGGLVDLVWDGNLKRQQVKSEWKAAQQQQFSRRIKVD